LNKEETEAGKLSRTKSALRFREVESRKNLQDFDGQGPKGERKLKGLPDTIKAKKKGQIFAASFSPSSNAFPSVSTLDDIVFPVIFRYCNTIYLFRTTSTYDKWKYTKYDTLYETIEHRRLTKRNYIYMSGVTLQVEACNESFCELSIVVV
jgi:hypothetical protein